MCGIAGIVNFDGRTVEKGDLKAQTEAIAHRGPDGEGFWISEDGKVGLGHRRLAIIDLSESAKQPMLYANRYSITYNGEIYNYKELKEDLLERGYSFNSTSDTEVLIAMYDAYGSDCLSQLDGMFAFAIYDSKEKKLFCARDRFGEKPFYYAHSDEHFVFGSEMKALWAAGVSQTRNSRMDYNHQAYGFYYNPDDFSQTFFEDCLQLPHAHFLELDVDSGKIITQAYWSLKPSNFEGTKKEAQKELTRLLKLSIKRRLRSDVELGSSLSGGLDSGILASLTSSMIKPNKLNTFSAIFPGYEKDESGYVAEIVQQLEVHSHAISPNATDWEKEKESFLAHQEEPVVDESPFLLYKVYGKAKKEGVKVLLDGQGADEVFGGYHAYFFSLLNELKGHADYEDERNAIEDVHDSGDFNDYDFFKKQAYYASIFKSKMAWLRKLKQFLQQFYRPKTDWSLFKKEHKNSFSREYSFETLNEHLAYDCLEGKLQNLLRYADRSSMAHGVEIRLPFLFHELVEFAFSLPASYKISGGFTKAILRDSFHSFLPPSVVFRRDKIGAEGDFKPKVKK